MLRDRFCIVEAEARKRLLQETAVADQQQHARGDDADANTRDGGVILRQNHQLGDDRTQDSQLRKDLLVAHLAEDARRRDHFAADHAEHPGR